LKGILLVARTLIANRHALQHQNVAEIEERFHASPRRPATPR